MKIAIVTWASSGLWKIFVDNLIKEKDLDQIRVLARSKDKLNELKTQYWDKIVPYTIDLSVHDEIIKFSKKLAETKCTIKYLVNNAWYGKFWASDEIPLEDSLKMIDLNIKAVVSMCYICTPFMHKWDHIINIASVHLQAWYIVIPGLSNPDHIAENYNIFDFELSDEDVEKISEIDKQKRYENW